jgi:hypothetical protein
MKNLRIFLILFAFISCEKETVKNEIVSTQIENISDVSVDSECAFLSRGSQEEVFLTWTEELITGNVLVYKKFVNDMFQSKITIDATVGLQSHHESMAKIAKTKEGVLYCLFRISAPTEYNKYGGALFYTISKDDGNTWSEKVKLISDVKSSSQSFYDLAQLENGELGLTWLDNRFSTKEKRGSTLFFTSTDGITGFKKEKPIAFNTCQCCRTDLKVDNGEVIIAFRNIIDGGIRDMFYLTSNDNGKNFTQPKRISVDIWEIDGCPHTGPTIASDNNKTGVVWFTAGQGNRGLFFAEKNNSQDGFEKRIQISKNGTHPQMVTSKGNYYIVYDEYYSLDDTTFQQIKLLKKNTFAADKIIEVTPKGTMNTHPVVEKINKNQLLVSWTNLDKVKKRIQSTIIKI